VITLDGRHDGRESEVQNKLRCFSDIVVKMGLVDCRDISTRWAKKLATLYDFAYHSECLNQFAKFLAHCKSILSQTHFY